MSGRTACFPVSMTSNWQSRLPSVMINVFSSTWNNPAIPVVTIRFRSLSPQWTWSDVQFKTQQHTYASSWASIGKELTAPFWAASTENSDKINCHSSRITTSSNHHWHDPNLQITGFQISYNQRPPKSAANPKPPIVQKQTQIRILMEPAKCTISWNLHAVTVRSSLIFNSGSKFTVWVLRCQKIKIRYRLFVYWSLGFNQRPLTELWNEDHDFSCRLVWLVLQNEIWFKRDFYFYFCAFYW